jgi:hypothetical protein
MGLRQYAKDIMKRQPVMGIKALLLAGKLETAQSSQEKKEWIHKVEQFVAAAATR